VACQLQPTGDLHLRQPVEILKDVLCVEAVHDDHPVERRLRPGAGSGGVRQTARVRQTASRPGLRMRTHRLTMNSEPSTSMSLCGRDATSKRVEGVADAVRLRASLELCGGHGAPVAQEEISYPLRAVLQRVHDDVRRRRDDLGHAVVQLLAHIQVDVLHRPVRHGGARGGQRRRQRTPVQNVVRDVVRRRR
jgi:hypothetical protein